MKLRAASCKLPAPAKWNRWLRLLGREGSRGYHLIDTQMQFLNWGDTLEYFAHPEPNHLELKMICPPWAQVSGGKDNLVLRAAELLKACYPGAHPGVRIFLVKRIPPGKGLGGGSSDAATTLLALNRLWGLQASQEALAEIALHLGCDVPFFLHGRAARAQHWGEVLTFCNQPEIELALLWTEEESLTKVAYQRFDELIPQQGQRLKNDFERLLSFFPKTAYAAKMLHRGGWSTTLSGSGTALLVPCKSSSNERSRLIALLKDSPITHYTFVRTANLSALHRAQL